MNSGPKQNEDCCKWQYAKPSIPNVPPPTAPMTPPILAPANNPTGPAITVPITAPATGNKAVL